MKSSLQPSLPGHSRPSTAQPAASTMSLAAAEIAEKVEQISTQGWCVLEDQLGVWDACAGETDWVGSTKDTFMDVLGRFASTTEPNRGPARYYMNVPMAPPFLTPLEHPGIQAVCEAVLGEGAVVENLASDTPLGLGSTFQEFHRDCGNDPKEEREIWTLVVNVNLTDVSADMGPFEIVPTTAQTDIAEVAAAFGQHDRSTGEPLPFPGAEAAAEAAAAAAPFPAPVPLLARKGDILIRDPRVVHRGTLSYSTEPRPALAYIFVPGDRANSWGLGKNTRIHAAAVVRSPFTHTRTQISTHTESETRYSARSSTTSLESCAAAAATICTNCHCCCRCRCR